MAVALSWAAVGVPASAAYATPSDSPVVRQAEFDAKTLRSAGRDANLIPASATEARKRISEHLTQQARNGRLVDEHAVTIASLPDPFSPGDSVDFAWDSEKVPESASYTRVEFADGTSQTGMGVEYGGGRRDRLGQRAAGGAGYSAAFNVKNMYQEDYGCATTWFVPGYAANRDHKIVSCYEVWAQDKTVHFVYNRWALWTPAPTTSFGYWVETLDFYVAARPWAGYGSTLAKLADWNPRSRESQCDSTTNLTLGGSYGGITGSVTIPMNTCEDYWLDIDTVSKKIGIDYLTDDSPLYGREGQMYMDVAGRYDAVNATVLPIWADYNWVTVGYCSIVCSERSSFVAKDSGW